MQRVRHDKPRQRAQGSWLSTARSAIQAARSGERLFPAKDGPFTVPEERVVENFEAAIKQAFGAGQEHGLDARVESSDARTDIACYSNAPVTSGRARSERVVFFAPGPVTEADLYKEKLQLSAAIRHHHRRRKRVGWLTENAGTITIIVFLLILAWFVTGR